VTEEAAAADTVGRSLSVNQSINHNCLSSRHGWVSANRNLFLSDIHFKPAKSCKNRKPLRPYGMKIADVIIKVINRINHQQSVTKKAAKSIRLMCKKNICLSN